MKKNPTGGYDLHQTITVFSNSDPVGSFDMSADGQYLAAHSTTEMKIYKLNSGTENFDDYQTISSLSSVSWVSLTSDGGHFVMSISMSGVKIYKNDGSSFS